MRMRALLCLVIFCLSLCVPAQVVRAAELEDGWETIQAGIDYREYLVEGPNRVYVARMDRSAEDIILDTAIAQGRLAYGGEKVSDMAKRYDDVLNFVEFPSGTPYGYRSQVVVAINGSFVIPKTLIPYSGVIQSGWYAKRFENFDEKAFGWKYDVDVTKRQVFIGECVYHNLSKQYVRNTLSGVTIPINGINIPRPSNSMVLYTSQYDTTTRTAPDGVEVLVEMRRASLILSEPWGAKGIVKEIRQNAGSTPIPFDHIVLSAHGTAADRLLELVEGAWNEFELEVDQELINCTVPSTEPNWVKTFAGITGDHTFLKAGVIIPHPNEQENTDVHPRTAIAFNDQNIYFIVVDGRQPGVSVGMTYVQLAAFSKENLAATWGLTLDGGGSSTMVVNGEVVNIPSDPCTIRYFLPVIRANNPGDPDTDSNDTSESPVTENGSLPSLICERLVGSGVMMVALQPRLTSTLFEPGFTVLTQDVTEVRLGPGTHYAVLNTVGSGREGTILHQIFDFDGIYAKGSYWWKVDFGTIVGWVSESSLMRPLDSSTLN
jgi:hypothetical protein